MKSEADPNESVRSDSRKMVKWTIAVAVMVPVLYVLSTGPVARLAQAAGMEMHWLWTFYAPLRWLASHCPAFESFMRWYLMDVWQFDPFK